MGKHTLRKYLLSKRVELYARVNELKDIILSENFTERDTINLEVAEAELKIVLETIEICNYRNKF